MRNLLYFWLKISAYDGPFFHKTVAKDKDTAISNVMKAESCPRCAIECKEVPKDQFDKLTKRSLPRRISLNTSLDLLIILKEV